MLKVSGSEAKNVNSEQDISITGNKVRGTGIALSVVPTMDKTSTFSILKLTWMSVQRS